MNHCGIFLLLWFCFEFLALTMLIKLMRHATINNFPLDSVNKKLITRKKKFVLLFCKLLLSAKWRLNVINKIKFRFFFSWKIKKEILLFRCSILLLRTHNHNRFPVNYANPKKKKKNVKQCNYVFIFRQWVKNYFRQ